MASADHRVATSAVRQILATKTQEVDFHDLAAELIEAFGGNRKFARLIHQQFMDANTGGMVKNQILKYVLGVLEKNAALTKDQPNAESQMSTDELLESAALVFTELQQHGMLLNGEAGQGQVEGVPPASPGPEAGPG